MNMNRMLAATVVAVLCLSFPIVLSAETLPEITLVATDSHSFTIAWEGPPEATYIVLIDENTSFRFNPKAYRVKGGGARIPIEAIDTYVGTITKEGDLKPLTGEDGYFRIEKADFQATGNKALVLNVLSDMDRQAPSRVSTVPPVQELTPNSQGNTPQAGGSKDNFDLVIEGWHEGNELSSQLRVIGFGNRIGPETSEATLVTLAGKRPDEVVPDSGVPYFKRDADLSHTRMLGWWTSKVFPNMQFYYSPKTRQILSVSCMGGRPPLVPRFPNGLGMDDTEAAFLSSGMIKPSMQLPGKEVLFKNRKLSYYNEDNTHLYVSGPFQLYFMDTGADGDPRFTLSRIVVRLEPSK